MSLTIREVAVLRVLADAPDEMWAYRIGRQAGFKESSKRMDVGTTNTLLALQRKGLVVGEYGYSLVYGTDTSRRWKITEAGRQELGEYAFGE